MREVTLPEQSTMAGDDCGVRKVRDSKKILYSTRGVTDGQLKLGSFHSRGLPVRDSNGHTLTLEKREAQYSIPLMRWIISTTKQKKRTAEEENDRSRRRQ